MWSNMTKVEVLPIPKMEQPTDAPPVSKPKDEEKPLGYSYLPMNPDDFEQDDPNTDNMFALMDKIKNCKE